MTDTRDEGVAREARSGPRDAAVRYEDRADRLEWDADLFDALAEFYDAYATSYRGSRSDPHKLTEEDAAQRQRSHPRSDQGAILMTYHKHLESAEETIRDTFDPATSALVHIGSCKMMDPARSNGVLLGAAIANMKRARDYIDSALESLELARSEATILAAKEGGPPAVDGIPAVARDNVTTLTPRIIATGRPHIADYPDQFADYPDQPA